VEVAKDINCLSHMRDIVEHAHQIYGGQPNAMRAFLDGFGIMGALVAQSHGMDCNELLQQPVKAEWFAPDVQRMAALVHETDTPSSSTAAPGRPMATARPMSLTPVKRPPPEMEKIMRELQEDPDAFIRKIEAEERQRDRDAGIYVPPAPKSASAARKRSRATSSGSGSGKAPVVDSGLALDEPW
jgi:hypothetical protein